MTALSSPARRRGLPLVLQLEANLAANDAWDVLHHPHPRRHPPLRRPGAHLINPLAVLVRALPRAQFRAWSRFLREADIHPVDFYDDVTGSARFTHVPFGRLLRYRDWLLAQGYPDLLAPWLTPPPAAVLSQAA